MTKPSFNKEVITYKFNLEILKTLKDMVLDDEFKEKLWRAYLSFMAAEHMISKYSAKTWTYPKNLNKN